jgi:F-type H+-transporting ATPase subunit epsilon
MAELFSFEIITPMRSVYSGDVVHVKAPGITGYFGILSQHLPYLTVLKIGTIEVDLENGKKIFATSGGYAEVYENKMTVLAETAEEASEIDIERAEKARDRALSRLQSRAPEIDSVRARLALMRALNRLKISALS